MKTCEPVISVIVAVYNRAGLLPRCLDTLVYQTIDEPYEILLIDDQSEDDSWDVICKWRDRFPDRIRVFRNPHKGVARAKNLGITQARGTYIAFVDSDDYIPYDAFDRLYSHVSDANCPDLVVSPICKISEKGKTIIGSLDGVSDVRLSILRGNYFYLVGKIIRRNLFLEFGLLPLVDISEDVAWVFPVVSRIKEIAVENKHTYFYEYCTNSVSTSPECESLARDAALASRRILDLTDASYRALALDYVIRRTSGYLWKKFPHYRGLLVGAIRKDVEGFLDLSSSVPDIRLSAGAVRLMMPIFCALNTLRHATSDGCGIYQDMAAVSSYALLKNGASEMVDLSRRLLSANETETENLMVHLLRDADIRSYSRSEMPDAVVEALDSGDLEFVHDWCVVRSVFEIGGLYLHRDLVIIGNADILHSYDAVIGYSTGDGMVSSKAFYARKGSCYLSEVLDTYKVKSKLLSKRSLADRLRMVAVGYAGLPLISKKYVYSARQFCAMPIETFIANPARCTDVPIISYDKSICRDGQISCPPETLVACYERRLSHQISEYVRSSSMLKNGKPTSEADTELACLKLRLKQVEREVKQLKASTAYRVGMSVTWPLRKVYNALISRSR